MNMFLNDNNICTGAQAGLGSREPGSPPKPRAERHLGSHPGALSSCCVCASFFCAPHRCYENLRSPAGKVTSPRCLPRPCPPPRPGWAGSLHPGQPLPSPTFPNLPSTLFLPHVLHCAGSPVLYAFLSSAREMFRGAGVSSGSGEGPGLLVLPWTSVFTPC